MRLLVVSNRLPFSVQIKGEKLSFTRSPGGLVSGLTSYLKTRKSSHEDDTQSLWVGWPGITVPEELQRDLADRSLREFQSFPVFLSETAMDKFYHGFCNKTIWPLFHYFPSFASYDPEYWEHYIEVNQIFCDAVMQVVEPDDVIWIHDYHLMLLPLMLRRQLPDIPIGFFLHIPFPAFEIFRLIPQKWRSELLEGLMGADLVGFHTHSYTQYFLHCVLRILGYENTLGRVTTNTRVLAADTFPMGIEFESFWNASKSEEMSAESRKLKEALRDRKIVLSVDRLDYSKGIINRLQGYEIFLQKNPSWHKKVVLLVIVVPSRIGVEHYQRMKKQIDESVGRINGKFGKIGWTPITYQYQNYDFNSLVAAYKASDVALITPLRDGMNLISKEYLASRTDGTGVLILSEMAGAASELGEAIIINPSNTWEIAGAIKDALEMPEEEQIRKNSVLQKRLARYDVVRWAGDFLNRLQSVKKLQHDSYIKMLTPAIRKEILSEYQNAKKRIIITDYDGTLIPFAPRPETARPSELVLNLLAKLSSHPATDVVLISGRDHHTLQNWFGHLPIGLVGEHGVWIRDKDLEWRYATQSNTAWKQRLLPILEMFVDRVPGAFIEEKDYSLVWHYRRADPELSAMIKSELIDHLLNFTATMDIQVLQGNKNIELRKAGVNKGTAVSNWLNRAQYDFIFAAGDDTTDEDLFGATPPSAYTIKVGIFQSRARFNLPNFSELLRLLQDLAT